MSVLDKLLRWIVGETQLEARCSICNKVVRATDWLSKTTCQGCGHLHSLSDVPLAEQIVDLECRMKTALQPWVDRVDALEQQIGQLGYSPDSKDEAAPVSVVEEVARVWCDTDGGDWGYASQSAYMHHARAAIKRLRELAERRFHEGNEPYRPIGSNRSLTYEDWQTIVDAILPLEES